VVVIAEGHAGGLHLLADAVQLARTQRQSSMVMSGPWLLGRGAPARGRRCSPRPAYAHTRLTRRVVRSTVQRMVRAGAAQAGPVHGLAKLRRRAIVVAGRLHLRVTRRLASWRACRQSPWQQFAHAVKLQPDGQRSGAGARRLSSRRSRRNRCSDRAGLQETSARSNAHFFRVLSENQPLIVLAAASHGPRCGGSKSSWPGGSRWPRCCRRPRPPPRAPASTARKKLAMWSAVSS
jgi:hypothetical protein